MSQEVMEEHQNLLFCKQGMQWSTKQPELSCSSTPVSKKKKLEELKGGCMGRKKRFGAEKCPFSAHTYNDWKYMLPEDVLLCDYLSMDCAQSHSIFGVGMTGNGEDLLERSHAGTQL
jgi:hypothetical protein